MKDMQNFHFRDGENEADTKVLGRMLKVKRVGKYNKLVMFWNL